MEIHGITIDPPLGFEAEETMVSFRHPPRQSTTNEKHVTLRPNLIVHARKLRVPKTLRQLTGEIVADLERAIPGLVDLQRRELTFADGVVGVALVYDHPTAVAKVRQLYALRIDDDRMTALTLTLDAASTTPAIEAEMLTRLAAARRTTP